MTKSLDVKDKALSERITKGLLQQNISEWGNSGIQKIRREKIN